MEEWFREREREREKERRKRSGMWIGGNQESVEEAKEWKDDEDLL